VDKFEMSGSNTIACGFPKFPGLDSTFGRSAVLSRNWFCGAFGEANCKRFKSLVLQRRLLLIHFCANKYIYSVCVKSLHQKRRRTSKLSTGVHHVDVQRKKYISVIYQVQHLLESVFCSSILRQRT